MVPNVFRHERGPREGSLAVAFPFRPPQKRRSKRKEHWTEGVVAGMKWIQRKGTRRRHSQSASYLCGLNSQDRNAKNDGAKDFCSWMKEVQEKGAQRQRSHFPGTALLKQHENTNTIRCFRRHGIGPREVRFGDGVPILQGICFIECTETTRTPSCAKWQA